MNTKFQTPSLECQLSNEVFTHYIEELSSFDCEPRNASLLDINLLKEYVGSISQAVYTTEVLEGTPAQLGLLEFLYIRKEPVILGLQSDEEISKQGYTPLNCLDTRIEYLNKILPPNSCMFVLPPLLIVNDDKTVRVITEEEELIKEVGIYRNPKIIHLSIDSGNKREQKVRKRMACKGKFQTFKISSKSFRELYN